MFAKKSGNVWASGWVSLKISRNTKAEEQNIKKSENCIPPVSTTVGL